MRDRVHIFISGFVQGIGFRSWAKSQARSLGLTGWVRNLPDKRVEVVAEGEKEKLFKLCQLLKEGPPMAEVKKIEEEWEEGSGEFAGFEFRT